MKMTRLSSNTDLGKGKNPNLTVSVLIIAPCTNRGHHFYIPLRDTVFDSCFHTSEPYRAAWGKGCVLHFNLNFILKYNQNIMPNWFHLNGHSFSSLHFLLLYSSKTEIRFPVNIGITGHVATTGEVILSRCFQIKVVRSLKF